MMKVKDIHSVIQVPILSTGEPGSLLRAGLFHGAVDFATGFAFFDGLPPVVGFLPAR